VGVNLKWSGEVKDPYPRFCRDQGGIVTVAGFLWAMASEGARYGSPLGSGLHQPAA
jgi:hypothetical protein